MSLSVERACAIVAHAENVFATGEMIEDAFVPFARGGATSRKEALDALYIAIADYYRRASRRGKHSQEMSEFTSYALHSGLISYRIACDAGVGPNSVSALALEMPHEEMMDFVAYLQTITPSDSSFFNRVYSRLGIEITQAKPQSAPAQVKPWWQFWS